jgi:hypothetical protein
MITSLTAAQEKFVKMSVQALGEWRETLGPAAWIVLGILMVGALLTTICAVLLVLRGGLHPPDDRAPDKNLSQ